MAVPPHRRTSGRARRRSRPRPRSRRSLPALAAATGMLTLAACGGVTFADEPDTFSTMGFTAGDALSAVRVELATAALDPLDVQVNQGAFDEQQFLSSVAADDPPDAVRMDRALIGGYAARGALVPLTDCLDDQGVDPADYRAGAIDEATLDGTVYGLPDSYDTRLLLVDQDVLAEAGDGRTEVDTSDWEGLRRLADDLHTRDGGLLTRIGFDPKIPEFFPLWVEANGGSLISDDGRTARLDSPEVVEALEYTVGLIDAQGGWGRFKSLRDSFDQFGAENQIAQGQIGAYPMEDWYINVLAGASPDVPLGTEPFLGRDGRPINFVSGASWAIPKGSAHPDEACEFITTMTAAESWIEAATAKAGEIRAAGSPYIGDFTGNVEADRVIREEIWEPTGSAAFDEASLLIDAVQDASFSVPANGAGTEFRRAWQSAVNHVLSGDKEPRQALEEAQDRAQTALDLAYQGER
ncbi:extracellular solute-binding protein [Streptomyces sp. PT12]|uniref:extracellular solute-binding protein n=1 Tax=Streptomyces sp. PT12 TaxID=1510197 RepID=UPI000DE3D4E0|nr:extracellular solute-binding protein [Streptomyces sp. PT12]RBM19438.1 sugar ABC transporter substrate-binding protein [Streptomyces sp. PT12]